MKRLRMFTSLADFIKEMMLLVSYLTYVYVFQKLSLSPGSDHNWKWIRLISYPITTGLWKNNHRRQSQRTIQGVIVCCDLPDKTWKIFSYLYGTCVYIFFQSTKMLVRLREMSTLILRIGCLTRQTQCRPI